MFPERNAVERERSVVRSEAEQVIFWAFKKGEKTLSTNRIQDYFRLDQ